MGSSNIGCFVLPRWLATWLSKPTAPGKPGAKIRYLTGYRGNINRWDTNTPYYLQAGHTLFKVHDRETAITVKTEVFRRSHHGNQSF